MNRKPLLVLACMLCVPIATLCIHGSATADSTYNSDDAFVLQGIETSAQCEERVKNSTTTTTTGKTATMYDLSMESCRSSCIAVGADTDYKWFGTAPACAGRKMNADKKPYKDCEAAGGTPVDWSYCGDSKTCSTGTKILCKMPTAAQSTGAGSTIRYLGKRPFCNADNKVAECGNLGGKEIGREKCNDNNECCTTGKYLKCSVPAITGG